MKLITSFFLAIVGVLPCEAAEPDRSIIPLPEPAFEGKIGKTYEDSEAAWPKLPAPPDRSDIVQAKQWLNEPVQEVLGEHIKSLTEYPPVQKAATFDFSELMKQLMSGKQ